MTARQVVMSITNPYSHTKTGKQSKLTSLHVGTREDLPGSISTFKAFHVFQVFQAFQAFQAFQSREAPAMPAERQARRDDRRAPARGKERRQQYSALPIRAAESPGDLLDEENGTSAPVDNVQRRCSLWLGVALVLLGSLLALGMLIARAMESSLFTGNDALDAHMSPVSPPSPPWWRTLPLATVQPHLEALEASPPSPSLDGVIHGSLSGQETRGPTFVLIHPSPSPHSPSPPPPSPSPPPSCATELAGRTNLREATPPLWCGGLRSDATRCERSYVARADGIGFSMCQFSPTSGICVAAEERLFCPPPPLPPPQPPSPPWPPPSNPPLPIVDQINLRFSHGGPSASLATAGVLVHTFDDITDTVQPWLPCHEGRWCGNLRDRFAASLLHPGYADIYSKGEGGFVVNANAVDMLCSYHGDGHSMAKACDEPGVSKWCVPGCGGGYEQCEVVQKTSWCSCEVGDFLCAWKPDELEGMMRQQQEEAPNGFLELKGYNEVRTSPGVYSAAAEPLRLECNARNGAMNAHRLFSTPSPGAVICQGQYRPSSLWPARMTTIRRARAVSTSASRKHLECRSRSSCTPTIKSRLSLLFHSKGTLILIVAC